MTTTETAPSDAFDTTVRPQDDLFGHVNNAWAAAVEMPEDRAYHGSFTALRDAAEINVRAIIAEAAEANAPHGSEVRKVGDLYASFIDEAAVEARGVSPLRPLFERVASVDDVGGFGRLLGQLARLKVAGPLGVNVVVDRGDPTRYLVHLTQAGLGLPDESYYRLDTHAEVRAKYHAFVGTMLAMAGIGGDDEARAVFDLEARIAATHWDRTAIRDAVKTYNLTSADQLTSVLAIAPELFEASGLDASAWAHVVVGQPDMLAAVARLLDAVELETWKRWAEWRVLVTFVPYLSSSFVEAHFDFYGRTLTGTPAQRERWKRAVGFVESAMGQAVGKLYVERHYSARAEAEMAKLIDNLIAAYQHRITDLHWMAEDTRKRALAKLEAFRPKIGKPVTWRDYEGLDVDADDLMGNAQRANGFDFDFRARRLGGPVDRDEWMMLPQTVNASYSPTMNAITFPAAILQPPFFEADADPAYNYGGIGAVIGHEIGHGFDDQGSRYDGDGTLRDWWTPEDRERFDVKVKALIAQYDAYSPRGLDDRHTVNGGLTVGENIGDLGGVAVAHHAYRLSLEEIRTEAPVIDGLTGDQRFFLGWARVWRRVIRHEEEIRLLTLDPHAPAEFRVHVVRNIDAFHDAFGTSREDGMWLEPGERIAIW